MMEFRPRRATSPGSRRIARGGSSSTGTLTFPSAFDQYQGPSRSSTGFPSGPRTSAERMGGSRVVPRYRQESPPRQSSQTDYVIRPRRLTLDVPDAAPRRPLSYIPPSSPSRPRPIITSAVEKPPGPLALANRPHRDEDYYIQPASSSSRREHHRNYTHGSIDTTRMGAAEREARDRWEHGVYQRPSSIRGVPGSVRGVYNTDPPYYRSHDLGEREPGYEYTDRREQVYRDTEPRPRTRRDSNAGRRERPISMAGLEDYLPRTNPSGRELGPPIAMDNRGFNTGERTNLGRSGSLKQSHRRPDNELPRDYIREDYNPSRARTSSGVPVVHQDYPKDYPAHRREVRDTTEVRSRKPGAPSIPEQRKEKERNENLDEQYGRSTDDRSTRYHDRGHRRGHEREDRDHRMREDDRARGQEISANRLVSNAAAAAAGAGIAAEGSRRRHHRHDHNKEESDPIEERVRNDDHGHQTKGEDPRMDSSSSTEDSDEEKHERRGVHRRHRETREGKEVENHPKDSGPVAPLVAETVHEESSREQPTRNEVPRIDEPSRSSRRHHHHHSHTPEKDSYSEDSASSEAPEKKPRQVRVVTPSEDPREPEPPIKSILRQPREKFPEDPAPVREGVAPLKDAGKKGIPPNARWTKIDRKLVNPEALLAGNERFEERPDYVIVLRVLTKEDIEAYALKTQEIRAKRGVPPNIHESH